MDVKIESFSFNVDSEVNIVGEGTKGKFLMLLGSDLPVMNSLENRYGWVSIPEFGHERFLRFVHPDSMDEVQHFSREWKFKEQEVF